MPKYHCAIQEQIEEQAGGISQWVNVRTYDAVHGQQVCKFIVRREQEQETPEIIDAHEFAQGKQIVVPVEPESEKPVTLAKPKPRELDEREKELLERMKNGAPVATDLFRKQIHDDVMEKLDKFTWDEHMRITYVPLVVQFVAWHYAMMAKKESADRRISELKPMSRAIVDMRKKFVGTLGLDLSRAHIQRLEDAAEQWMDETRNEQTIMLLQIKQAYMDKYRDVPYMDLRVFAMCAMLLADYVNDYQEKIDAMICERLNRPVNSLQWQYMVGLKELMKGIVDEYIIEPTLHIKQCLAVMTNRLGKIKWIEEPGKV